MAGLICNRTLPFFATPSASGAIACAGTAIAGAMVAVASAGRAIVNARVASAFARIAMSKEINAFFGVCGKMAVESVAFRK